MTGDVDVAPDVHESVLGLLADSYGTLGRAWLNMLGVQDVDRAGPWNRHQGIGEEDEASDLLVSMGQNAAILAATSVGRHVGTLTRAYGPDPGWSDDRGGDRWPHSAVFAPARAIAEGTALVAWLLDPEPERAERIMRAARLAIWSSPRRWGDVVTGAGLELRKDERGTPMVWAGEDSRPLSVGSLVKIVHGPEAVKRTNQWSKLLHNDPDLLAPLATIRQVDGGAFVGSQVREDQHLRLALDITELLRTSGVQQAAYWARGTGGLPEACDRVRACVEPVLAGVEEYQRRRDLELFEP